MQAKTAGQADYVSERVLPDAIMRRFDLGPCTWHVGRVKLLLFCRAGAAFSNSLHRCYPFQSPRLAGYLLRPAEFLTRQRASGSRGPTAFPG